jgi:predicted regulator of amino acid metabolism with ACT domain
MSKLNLDKLIEVNTGNVPPEVIARIDLVNKFNLTQSVVDRMTSAEVILEYEILKNKSTDGPLKIDIDDILLEWSYRCETGFPVYGNISDMICLQEILDERNIDLPFERITEISSSDIMDQINPKLIESISKLGKFDEFNKYVKECWSRDNMLSRSIITSVNELTDTDELATIFKSIKNIDGLSKITVTSGLNAKLFSIRPPGIGPGELLISWLVKDAVFKGGNESYDISCNNKKWEVKSLYQAGRNDDSIDPASYGKIDNNKTFTKILRSFYENIIEPFYINKLEASVIAMGAENNKLLKILNDIVNCINNIPRVSNSGTRFSDSLIEVSASSFDKIYTNIELLHKLCTNATTILKIITNDYRLIIKSSTTDVQYKINPEDAQKIINSVAKNTNVSIKVWDEINKEDKDAEIWLNNLVEHPFIKDPKTNFIEQLKQIRDGFLVGKDGLILITKEGISIVNNMSEFYIKRITRGHFRIAPILSNTKSLDYSYAQGQL